MSRIGIQIYRTIDGKEPMTAWLDDIRDGRTRARILARLDRLRAGLFGDWRSIGRGLCELRIDDGPGYRIYYARHDSSLVLLLCGGSKGTQSKDIEKAHAYWKDYQARYDRKPPLQGLGTPEKRGRNRRLH